MSLYETSLADIKKLFAAPGWITGFPAGKPVAVTSNRGQGRVPIRPGANPQAELEYYQRRYAQPQSGSILSDHIVMECLNTDRATYMSQVSSIHVILSVPERSGDDDLPGTPSQDTPDFHDTSTDQEATALSMAEIASCSYEAR